MPSWKPDCLKSSATFNQISHTINSAKLLHADIHDGKNHLTNNSKSSLRDDSYKQGTLTKSDASSHNSNRALSFQNASSSKISLQKGYSLVELIRSNNSQFGLTIAGGTDKDSRPRICDLKAGSIAHRSDELQIGDMIMSINGIKTQGLKHEEIIDLIKNAGDSLCLEFEYNLPPWPIHPHHAVRSQNVHIQLEKENNSYGFTLRGGFNEEKLKSRPLIVTNIRSGGSADREGTLKIGDRIIAINGVNVLNATLQDTYNIIKQCKGMTLFLVEYDSAVVDSIKNSNGPLLIEIEKSPGSSIGIKLALNKTMNGKSQILVESVKPASIADRCGAIYVGDQILSIDDVSFEHVTLAEANQILKNCVGEFSRVEILPLSQMLATKAHKNANDIYENGGGSSTKSNSSTFTVNSSSSAASMANNFVNNFHILQQQQMQGGQANLNGNSLSNFNSSDSLIQIGQLQNHFNQNLNDLTIQTLQKMIGKNNQTRAMSKNSSNSTLVKGSSRDRQNSISSINSCTASLNSNQVSHSEVVDFLLKSDENGTFGFTLQGAGVVMSSGDHSNDTIQNIVPYPVVGYVEPSSAAEKSSLMQPGDRIISVNSRSLEGLSVEDARKIIKESGSNLRLEIEFDVADTIMLTSGVFQVKLLKKSLDLGITVQYPRYWKAENYPYISDLKKGSVAYRNGMLQRGDTILFIDNISLRNKTLNEINQLLKATDEIVKLKIRKEEQVVEDPDEKIVVYTVEMQRNGGPLGITISGSDDLFEPMFVSGLTEGGLAERTNAIHVGDIILAINNVSLRGKSLSEAIELLQNADDMVTLKISRKLEKGNLRLNSNSSNIQAMPNGYKMIPSHQTINEKDEFSDDLTKSSQQFSNENTNSVNNQYLPFPMDMTNFIKSNSIKSKSVVVNGNGANLMNESNASNNNAKVNNNNNKNNQKFTIEDLKKKAASLDSINAVERELDEVLKDLELNSQDLNEQLNDNVYQHNHHQNQNHSNTIELPINIQKSSNHYNPSSPKSINKNKWSSSNSDIYKNKPTNNSINNNTNGNISLNEKSINEYYDQSLKNLKYQMKVSNEELDYKKQQFANSLRKRQNIISTYELCHDCFENCGLVQSNGEPACHHHTNSNANGHISKYTPKNHKSAANVSDFTNYNGNYLNKGSPSHQSSGPVKYGVSYQDLSNQPHNSYSDSHSSRSRTVLSQINESVVPEPNQPVSILRSNKNIDLSGNKTNGITSQKVITIGLPNGQKMADQSPSPNLAESRSKSIPIQKVTTSVQLKTVPEKEEKLDKLPPVPPSSWSTRRNQPQYSSNNRLRRQNNKTPTNQNDSYDQNPNTELTIQESGTSSFEEESNSSSSQTKTDTTIQSVNTNNNGTKVNYDNFNVAEDKSESEIDEKIEVTISKDPRFKDFGFSISDNFFGTGILINKLRNGSPAEENAYLKPFTQIYKINNIDCTKLDCAQVSKILANDQTNTMRLIVSIKPKRLSLSNEATLSERKMNLQNAYAISSSRATAL